MTTTTRSTGSVAKLAGQPAEDHLSRLRSHQQGLLRRTSRRRVRRSRRPCNYRDIDRARETDSWACVLFLRKAGLRRHVARGTWVIAPRVQRSPQGRRRCLRRGGDTPSAAGVSILARRMRRVASLHEVEGLLVHPPRMLRVGHQSIQGPRVKFASHSPVEGGEFEPSVPRQKD